FTVDTSAPSVTITYPGEGALLNTGDFDVTWTSGSTDIAYYLVSVDGGAPVNVGLATSYHVSLSDGPHSVNVTAVDEAGNSGWDVNSFTVDTSASMYTHDVPEGVNQLVNASVETGVELLLNLSRPVSLIVSNTTNNFGGSAPSGLTFLGQFVYIAVNDTEAIEGLTITMYYDDQVVAGLGLDENSLQIYYWNETSGSWVALVCGRDTDRNIVWASLDHLTEFTIMGSAPPAPPFNFTPLLVLLVLMGQQGFPLMYVVIGAGVVVVALIVGLALRLRRGARSYY
ncbi:MAG: hypothetical protein QXR19_08155, partial [Candidatus Jordarchaeaceae archaeon]